MPTYQDSQPETLLVEFEELIKQVGKEVVHEAVRPKLCELVERLETLIEDNRQEASITIQKFGELSEELSKSAIKAAGLLRSVSEQIEEYGKIKHQLDEVSGRLAQLACELNESLKKSHEDIQIALGKLVYTLNSEMQILAELKTAMQDLFADIKEAAAGVEKRFTDELLLISEKTANKLEFLAGSLTEVMKTVRATGDTTSSKLEELTKNQQAIEKRLALVGRYCWLGLTTLGFLFIYLILR